MRIEPRTLLACLLLAVPGGALAEGAPMSAIDWLSDSLAAPRVPRGQAVVPSIIEPEVTVAALPEVITVTGLDSGPVADAVGLLPSRVTGLPNTLWGGSSAPSLARRISVLDAELLPALQHLLYSLLLAEVAPPTGGDGATLFLARVDKLLEMGALDQAAALLERAASDSPEILRRRFDVALLLGEEQAMCERLAQAPELSPTYQTRIFCLARAGDWAGAALLLGTGRALGLIPGADAELFERFLDPDLFEGEPPLDMPLHPTPLTFRMYEAIGESIPVAALPLAFVHSDLRPNIGWKARIEAAERLARTGAVSQNQLLALYTERRPAASGGVWDRARALQRLEARLDAHDKAGTGEALSAAWDELSKARVEVPIARILGPEVAALGIGGNDGALAFRFGLLSDDYERVAMGDMPSGAGLEPLAAIARGETGNLTSRTPRLAAVLNGFAARSAPIRLASLLENGRLGEAILRAIALFNEGVSGDYDQITDAIALFRAVGLEDTARRAALEFLILDRHG